MTFLEKELEDYLFEMLKDPIRLYFDRNFDASGGLKWKRQMNIGDYGIADIVGIKIECNPSAKKALLTIHVIELKKDEVNYQTLGQACRYANGILIEFQKQFEGFDLESNVTISLVGTSIDEKSDFGFIINNFANLNVYKVTYDPYKGLFFDKNGGDYIVDASCNNCLAGIELSDFENEIIINENIE